MFQSPPCYSFREEVANTTTHGIGALLSIAASVLLVVFSARNGDVWHIVSSAIFGSTLILLYSASTFYHLATGSKIKGILRAIDHSSIFLLIAGTYTPFTLVNLRGNWGWTLFILVWTIAIAGIILETVTRQRLKKLSLALYLGLGWLIVFAIHPIMEHVDPGGVILLIAGGLSYSIGVVFYLWKSMIYHHAVWHLFVLAGSTLHFFSVFFYVIPAGS